MTRINSTLRVSSKIGLVMLFCHLVLVRDICSLPPSLKNLPKKIYIYITGARACLGRKYVFPNQKNKFIFFLNRLLFDQILRDWRHSSFNHARLSVQDNGQRRTAIRGRDVWRNEIEDLICYTEIDVDERPDFFSFFLGLTKLMLILILTFCFCFFL